MSRMSELAARKWEAEKSPRKYWTPAERAGLKAMGREVGWWEKKGNKWEAEVAAMQICCYIQAAMKAKGEPR